MSGGRPSVPFSKLRSEGRKSLPCRILYMAKGGCLPSISQEMMNRDGSCQTCMPTYEIVGCPLFNPFAELSSGSYSLSSSCGVWRIIGNSFTLRLTLPFLLQQDI